MTFKLKGTNRMQKKLRALAARYPERVDMALFVEGEIEMVESKKRVPVDTTVLQKSGFVSLPTRIGGKSSVTLSYGGAAEDYAIVQHEDPDLFHPNGGQWKYLESVLNESAPSMARRLARRLEIG